MKKSIPIPVVIVIILVVIAAVYGIFTVVGNKCPDVSSNGSYAAPDLRGMKSPPSLPALSAPAPGAKVPGRPGP